MKIIASWKTRFVENTGDFVKDTGNIGVGNIGIDGHGWLVGDVVMDDGYPGDGGRTVDAGYNLLVG